MSKEQEKFQHLLHEKSDQQTSFSSDKGNQQRGTSSSPDKKGPVGDFATNPDAVRYASSQIKDIQREWIEAKKHNDILTDIATIVDELKKLTISYKQGNKNEVETIEDKIDKLVEKRGHDNKLGGLWKEYKAWSPTTQEGLIRSIDNSYQQVQLENTKDMQQIMQTLNIDVKHYKIPDNLLKGSSPDVQEKIGAFNTVLEAIHKELPFRKPFAVTISANDLGGYGDVVAGAKLAKELMQFYQRIEEWKDTPIFLHLTGTREKEKTSKEKVVKDILQGTSVHFIYDLQDKELSQDREHVRFAYPTISKTGPVDFSVMQYGIGRFSDASDTYSSGPGYGSLGTLGIPENRLQQAIEAADHPEQGSLIYKLDQLLREDNVESFHFGYFSTSHPKDFVKKIREKTEKTKNSRIGIVIAKSQSKITDYVDDFRQKDFTVRVLQLDQMGVKQDNTSKGIKGDQRWEPEQADKHVTLVNFPDGVAQQDMLSLYYRSDAPVGATGDQSFIEAYQIRSKKIEPSVSPDIWYDVSLQQGHLRYQLIELEDGEAIHPGNTVAQGLSAIKIHGSVTEALQKKNLVYPIAMLVNQTLQKREG